MLEEIAAKIRETQQAFKRLNYSWAKISAKEFYDYMTGEIFSEDTTTLQDVLGNEFLMVHELAEMSELKKTGRKINEHTLAETPKKHVYTAHFSALEQELNYALLKKDTFYAKIRLTQHKESVLDTDPNLPEELRPRAERILEKYRKLIEEATTQHV
ncbi:MAG: hypothetical protein ACLFU9_08065 [Candidatus Bathyarchaeia archaeon]